MKTIYVHSIALHATNLALFLITLDFISMVSVKYAIMLGCLYVLNMIAKAFYLLELEKEKMKEFEEESEKIRDLIREMEKGDKND